MADTAVSSFQTLTGANLASGDLIPVIDVSASGALKNSKMTPAELLAGLLIQGNTSLGTNAASGTLNLGTISDTTARPLNVSQTWNNASLTACGLRLSVTDTSSASGSMLMDLRGGASGSTSYFSVGRTGTTIIGSPSTNSLEIVGGSSLYLQGRYGGSGTNRASISLNRVNGQSIVLNGNASGSAGNEGVYASAGGGGGGNEGGSASCVLGGFFAAFTQLSLTVKPIAKDALGSYTGDGHLLYLCGGKASSVTTGGAGGAAYVIGGDAAGSGNNNGGDVILKGGAATGSGTKGVVQIGEATTDLISFFGGTAVAQPGSIADAAGDAGTGSDTVDLATLNSTLSNMQTAINSLISNLENLNLIAAI